MVFLSLYAAFVGAHLGRQFEFVQSQWINDGAIFGGAQDEFELQVFSRVPQQIDVPSELRSNFKHDQFPKLLRLPGLVLLASAVRKDNYKCMCLFDSKSQDPNLEGSSVILWEFPGANKRSLATEPLSKFPLSVRYFC